MKKRRNTNRKELDLPFIDFLNGGAILVLVIFAWLGLPAIAIYSFLAY